MKNRDVEKKIISSLEESEHALNPHILDAARCEIKENPSKKKSFGYKFAIIACISVIICLAVALPIIFFHNNISGNQNLYTESQYSSMYEYFKENNIKINTYEHLFDNNMDIQGSDTPYQKSPYSAEECVLAQSQGTDIFIRQKYNYFDADSITVYVLLSEDENLKQTVFEEFLNLEKSTRFLSMDIDYSFDGETNKGKASFIYNEIQFYIEFFCNSETAMLAHIQALLISQ